MKIKYLLFVTTLLLNTSAQASDIAGEKAVKAATQAFFDNYVSGNFQAVFDAFADDGVWCAGTTSSDYPFTGCYVGKESIIQVMSKAAGAFNVLSAKLNDISANDTTGYMQIDEVCQSSLTGVSHRLYTMWTAKFKKVQGQLKIVEFNYMHRDADLPTVRSK